MYSPWTLVTAPFVETTIFEFVASLIFVPAALKYLERLWGGIEVAKFIAVVVIPSNFLTILLNWLEFIATRNADLFLYGMHYHGQMALQIALLVAFTQLIPEHQVQIFGVLKARVKNLPILYLAISCILSIVGFQCPWILVQFGWFFGWVYLRFYKKNSNDTLGGQDTYGDRSETFSLVSWFPPFLHHPVSLLGDFVFKWATRLHLIPSVVSDVELGGYGQPLPAGMARAEAERRRAMALKALDQRLANNSSPVASSSTNSSQHRATSTTNVGRIDKSSSSSSNLPLSGESREIEEVGNNR